MHPTIAAAVATQRQHELRAAADQSRRIRAARPSARRHSSVPTRTVRIHPRLTFQMWLAAGRL